MENDLCIRIHLDLLKCKKRSKSLPKISPNFQKFKKLVPFKLNEKKQIEMYILTTLYILLEYRYDLEKSMKYKTLQFRLVPSIKQK